MKGLLSTLIPLAGFAALMATFLVPWLVAQYQFQLRDPWPMLVGLGSLGLTLFGLFLWVLHLQRKARKVLAISLHPIFGEVQQRKDHWEASVPLAADSPRVEVWGEALEPLPAQVSTFAAIRDRYSELLARTIAAASALFDSLGISVSAEELLLESIYLDDSFGSFDLTFSAPAHERKLPWGLSATFSDFAVDEISDNH
jgi:hypothetical protein